MRLSPDTVRDSVEAFVHTVLQRVADLPHADIAQLRDDWHDLCRLTPDETKLWTPSRTSTDHRTSCIVATIHM